MSDKNWEEERRRRERQGEEDKTGRRERIAKERKKGDITQLKEEEEGEGRIKEGSGRESLVKRSRE